MMLKSSESSARIIPDDIISRFDHFSGGCNVSPGFRIILLLVIVVLSGCGIGLILWLSPNPMPSMHTEFMAAVLGIFSMAGYGLVRGLCPPASAKKPKDGSDH